MGPVSGRDLHISMLKEPNDATSGEPLSQSTALNLLAPPRQVGSVLEL